MELETPQGTYSKLILHAMFYLHVKCFIARDDANIFWYIKGLVYCSVALSDCKSRNLLES